MSDFALDSMFAGCRIEGVAGRGGMGIVYRATQLPLGRAVALKLVSPERAANATFRARFEREARITAAIEHPNVIPVYAAGEEDGQLYIVMRWVKGTDLQALIAEGGALDPASAAEIVRQVGAGLDAAHEAGLVHRDVKPANVLIAGSDASGHVYLTDFGLTLEVSGDTRLTESGEWLGSVNFMAPEQFEGGPLDARTDVYALACVLHTALTGQPPFARRTVIATMRAHLDEPPPRPSATPGVPASFDAVIARALAKRPGDRYQSAGELVDAVLAAVEAPESKRAGDAGRARIPATNGSPVAAAGESAPTQVQPGSAQSPPLATARLARARRRPTRPALVAAGATVAAAALIATLAVTGLVGDDEESGPLSDAEVRAAVGAFATAYADEDAGAMADALTRDVARVTPGDSQRGRGAVIRQYRRQFAANATEDYTLRELDVRSGSVGRASGRYVASRSGGPPITGRVVFGVRREDGQPRVGLIALTPSR